MDLFSALLGGFPVTKIFKIVAILAVVAAVFGGGYYVGSLAKGQEMQRKVDEVQTKLNDEIVQHNKDKAAWEKARAELADQAAKALKDSIENARAVEAKAQATIAKVNQDWAARLQRIKNDAQAALDRVLHPVATDDPLTDGLWVDTTDCTAAGGDNKDRANGVPQASNGVAAPTFRCRLHPATAERLIQSAAAANQVVTDYNACADSLKVLSPLSFPPAEAASAVH